MKDKTLKIRAINEVSIKWGEEQTISGPFISIPYYKYVKQFSKKNSIEKIVQLKEYIHILPKTLNINGEINPEKRYRSIYEVVVYNSKLIFLVVLIVLILMNLI